MAMAKRKEYQRETESPVTVAPEQAIKTKTIKAKIGRTQVKSKCRL